MPKEVVDPEGFRSMLPQSNCLAKGLIPGCHQPYAASGAEWSCLVTQPRYLHRVSQVLSCPRLFVNWGISLCRSPLAWLSGTRGQGYSKVTSALT